MRFLLPSRIAPTPVALAVVAVACGGGEQADADAAPEIAPEAMPTVQITQPEEGSTVGPDVQVVLVTEGIEIVSITPPVVGTGHHHIYVDVDVASFSEMIPQNDPQIIHMGDGSTEYMLQGLEPGEHRLIAVVADPAHIPIDPPVVDTLHFTVSNQ